MRSSYLKRHVKWFKSIVAAFKTKGEKVKRTLHIKHCWNTIRKKEKNTTHSGAIFETCQTGRFYSMNKSLLDTNKNIPRFFLPHSKVLCFFSQSMGFIFVFSHCYNKPEHFHNTLFPSNRTKSKCIGSNENMPKEHFWREHEKNV